MPSVHVYARLFFITSFSLSSLNVVCRYDTYTKCEIHFDKFSLFTVQTDKFLLCHFFSVTMHLLKSLHARFSINVLVIEKLGKVARTDQQIELAT